MPLNLINLDDDKVREFMLDEFESDVKKDIVYKSKRLKEDSYETYFNLMRIAIKEGNDITFANQIQSNNCLKTMEPRKFSSGIKLVKVRRDAHNVLAEGQFNRSYLRGICLKAIENDLEIEIYRAKMVRRQRPESEAKIGMRLNPKTLLNDLRENIGIETILGLPGGPNSGLSGKLVEKK